MNHSILLLAILAFTFALGCSARPRFGPQGTIGMQRSRAVIHDPFPNNDLGPPIVSGRPLGFDRPQDETRNLQQVRDALLNSPINAAPIYPQYQNGGAIGPPVPTIQVPTPQSQPGLPPQNF